MTDGDRTPRIWGTVDMGVDIHPHANTHMDITPKLGDVFSLEKENIFSQKWNENTTNNKPLKLEIHENDHDAALENNTNTMI